MTTPNAPAEILERAPEPIADPANPTITADAPAQEQTPVEQPAPKPEKALSPRDQRMKDIAEKVKASREGIDATGDYTDPAQAYGKIAGEPEAAVDDAPAPATSAGDTTPAPRKFKVKVLDQERELTEEELIANAQKSLAADDYLEKARRERAEAGELLKAARSTARPNQAEPSEQPDDQDDPAPAPSQTKDDDLKALIEEIQIGDPEQAAAKLRQVLNQGQREAASASMVEARMKDDHSKTMATFEKFATDNADVLKDPINEAIMERMLDTEYRTDLRALGWKDENLPRDTNKLADFHRLARVQGERVRSTDQLLTTVKDGFQKWRGIAPAATTQSQAPRDQRVQVDRTERRQAIPNQPSRSTAPSQTAPNTTPQPRTRSAVIENMKRSRGQLTAA